MRQKAVDPKYFPVSLSQQRLWVVGQLHPGTAAYHIPVCLRLTGLLDLDALERSLEAVVARHESLRTTFGIRDNVPVQYIRSSCEIALQLKDIRTNSDMNLEPRAHSIAREEIQKPFDLANGPLNSRDGHPARPTGPYPGRHHASHCQRRVVG